MSRVIVTESHLEDIAGAIRAKLGVQTTYKPGQMAAAIGSIAPALQSKTVTQNGVVTPDRGYDGLPSVTVNFDGGQNLYGESTPTAAQGNNGDTFVKFAYVGTLSVDLSVSGGYNGGAVKRTHGLTPAEARDGYRRRGPERSYI